MPKVSIIVPVYNVEKYLDRCVQSIVNQTYPNWELLLVDDGSPDRSGVMCDEWAKKDNRIKAIHQKNGGVSAARNNGLNHANGKWVLFVDSDDWIDKECMEVCMATAQKENLDIVQFNFMQIDYKDRIKALYSKKTPALSSMDYIEHGVFNVCVWGSMLRRDLIEKHHTRFPEGIKLAEDQMFIMECMAHSNKIQLIKNPFYCYFLNENSAVHGAKTEDILNSCNKLKEFKEHYPMFSEHIGYQINSFCATLLCNGDISSQCVLALYDKTNAKTIRNADRFGRMMIWAASHNSPAILCFVGLLLRTKHRVRNIVVKFR